jgi:hypothetical protein
LILPESSPSSSQIISIFLRSLRSFAAIKDGEGQGFEYDWFSVSDRNWVAIRVSFAETSGGEKSKTLSGGIAYG